MKGIPQKIKAVQMNENSVEKEDERHPWLKDALYQGELSQSPYALSVNSPKIEPIDKRMVKANAHEAMVHHAEQQMHMLRKQAELLLKQARDIEKRLEISHSIYKADIGFEPVIGGVYHLYERKEGTRVLSMVAPYEWGREMPFVTYLNTVQLLADRTWQVLE